MNKKRTKLLILSCVFFPLLLPSCSYFFSAGNGNNPNVCPRKRVNVGWTIIESGTDETLRGIYGGSHSDVITVGEKGTIRRCREVKGCDAMECIPMTSKTGMNLRGIYGYFRGDKMHLFAVGDRGTIQRYDGNKKAEWSPMKVKTRVNLRGIWGDFRNKPDVFAVGDEGTILLYDNDKNSWFPMTSNTDENLNNIWGVHKKDFFIVGNGGTILHYKDNKCSAMKNGTDKNLNGIWGSSREDIFAVGDGGTILHYDGSEWSEMKSTASENLNAVWGRLPNDVFAVGDRGRILHYNGNKEKEWRKLPRPTIENLHDIWISQNPHVFVIGENGIEASKEYAAIWGYIRDSTTGDGIEDAIVKHEIGGQFSQMGDATDSTGKFDHRKETLALNPSETFKFTCTGYSPSDEVTIDVADDCWFDIRTYLFPTDGYQNSISGVISEVTVITVEEEQYQYSQVVGHDQQEPPLTVELYKKGCGNYPTTPECYASTSNGHYYFPHPDSDCPTGLAAGTYKVVPKQSGYTFDPEYDTIDIVVPQDEHKAYNFTRQD